MKLTKAAVLVAMLMMGLALAPGVARAHGWYDAACCSGRDCSPVLKQWTGKDGRWHVLTKHGSATIERGLTEFRPSKDDRFHACIVDWRIPAKCLYAPTQY